MAKIGFIGLGLMGSAMVQRLLDKGHALTVLGNRDRTGVDAAIERGATEADSPRALAEASDIVMLCMGTSEQVEGRMNGEDGVLAGLSEGDVVIDFGTSLPASTKALAEAAAAKGAAYLDGPLGRTPSHGREGKLNIMGGGDRDAFDRVRPVLEDLGENVFHLGGAGSGHTIKLINNFVGMTIANAVAEAFAMADSAGIARQDLFDVMGAGPLRSAMMEFVAAYGVDGDPDQLAFSIANAAKDVGYYRRMAEELGARTVMSAGAAEGLSLALEEGRGEDMVSTMVDTYAKRFGG